MNKENVPYQIAYIHSPKLVEQLNKIPRITGRAEMVNSLIESYSLFSKLKIVAPVTVDQNVLKTFHSQEYLAFLNKCSLENDEEKFLNDSSNSESEHFGLGYDCPIIDNINEFCMTVAGGSYTAAHLINLFDSPLKLSPRDANYTRFKYVFNWYGGWHHAKRDRASGFCYVNDIVLCILKLRQRYNRILYLDLDLHHGDGVQDAFEYTNKVMTLSFHKLAAGFFPGTGTKEEIGKGSGLYHTVNVPLLGGLDDKTLSDVFNTVFNQVIATYKPEVIVAQCGADSLYGDPIDQDNSFNLTVDGYCKCVKTIIDTDLPIVFLAGGGYNLANSARLWTSIVALLTNEKLKNDIPDHEYFLKYGPDYELNTPHGLYKNQNTPEYIKSVSDFILANLSNIKA